MTETAKGGGLCESKKTSKNDQKDDDAKTDEDLDPSDVSLCPLFGCIEKIDPENFN